MNKIHLIRNHKVMLDMDLAELYHVTSKRLNESVKRNASRFPGDFMFQLTDQEWEALRSQFATSKKGRGGRRYAPFAFSEHGVLMLSSVLNSERAVQVNIQIMRAYTKLREVLLAETAQHQRGLGAEIKSLVTWQLSPSSPPKTYSHPANVQTHQTICCWCGLDSRGRNRGRRSGKGETQQACLLYTRSQ